MKKLFIGLTFLLLFFSCDKKYEPIKNYVETQGDTRSDLSFKGLEYRIIQIIKAKDSMELAQSIL